MPVSVITDVITWLEMVAQIGVSTVELGVLSYLVYDNGWLNMIRLISFWLDTMLIKYTDLFYTYFEKLLGGTIFTPQVVERVQNNIYIFVSVIVLFKLMMLFLKYLSNPDAVADSKIGVQSLVKRILIGMAGILLLPTIFNMSISLQQGILSDNLFGKILLTETQLREYERNHHQMGRVLAFNVYQAFWNIDANQVPQKYVNDYKEAVNAKDPEVFGDINEESGGEFVIDYFPILSTVVLFYVFYLIIKYCLDVVVRLFKLFLLQMLGPLAISDYMVNGDSKDMFKAWLKTTISTYVMLFVRIFSIWFVAFITSLMNETCPADSIKDGVCTTSLLYTVNEPDYLLRGLITIGLLAFLMDLPKLLSEIFGLDLEQDASVKGLMNKVGVAAKMVGVGAIAAGGAAIGGAISSGKNLMQAGKAKAGNAAKFDQKMAAKDPGYTLSQTEAAARAKTRLGAMRNMNKLRKQYAKDHADDKDAQAYTAGRKAANSGMAASGAGVARGAFAGLMSTVPGLKQASSGYAQGQNAADKDNANMNQKLAERDRSKKELEEINTKEAEKKEKEREKEEMMAMQANQNKVNEAIMGEINHRIDARIKAEEQKAQQAGMHDASQATSRGKKYTLREAESSSDAPKVSAKATIDGFEVKGKAPTIDTTATVSNVDTGNVVADLTANAKVDKVDVGNQTVDVKVNADVDLSKINTEITPDNIDG